MGLPFCRGETRMALGPDRDGRAWGFGCWILGALLGAGGFDASGRAVGAAPGEAAAAEAPARGLLSSIHQSPTMAIRVHAQGMAMLCLVVLLLQRR